ncbi:MAG: translocation/assembly module TamB domain-containing protein [Bacteroidales bacterium]|nr:translocation/assembly module TamB domain-containing protein [Bacteroidales bacterium]
MVVLSIITSIFVAIQDPIIQKFAIRIAGGFVSQITEADIRIGRLYISPDFTIHIDHFLVKDLQDADLLSVEELRVRPVMEDIIQGNIHVGRVELSNAHANLITYEGEDHMNFQFIIDAFSSDKEKEKEKSGKTIPITVDHVMLKDLDFQLWNQNSDNPEKTEKHLMDYSHLVLRGINLDAQALSIIGDSISATINHLAAIDTSGFQLNNFESQVIFYSQGILLDGLKIGTPNSDLRLDLHMLYPSTSAFNSFVDSVTFDANILPSIIQVSDLGPFSDLLYKMTDPVQFQGWMKGPIRSFKVDKLKFALGNHTNFVGSLALHPLDFEKGKHQLNIKKLNYSYDDLANFHIPISSGVIPMPSALEPLGQGSIKGFFSGSMEKFKTELDVTSEIGNVTAVLNKSISGTQLDVFEGDITAEHLNVGLLANAPKVIGTLDLSANVTARHGKRSGLDLDIQGDISDVMLLGNYINDISLDGNLRNNCFNGNIDIADDELDLDFKGRFDFNNPKALGGDFTMEIASADLHQLNIIKDDQTAMLTASIRANMDNINNFDQIEGALSIKDVSFTNSRGHHVMKQFDANIVNDNLLQKRIDLNCDFFDFEMAGKMNFATIAMAIKQYVYSYVVIPQWTESIANFEKGTKSSEQDFIVSMNLKNPKPLTKLLVPSVSIANNTTLNGTFTSKSQSLNLSLRSNYVNINNIKIKDINCRSFSSPRRSTTRLTIDHIILRDSTESNPSTLGLDGFNIVALLQNDTIRAQLGWDDDSYTDHNRATINTSFVPSSTGGRFNINYADILINDSIWSINPDNFVVFDDGNIQISNLELSSLDQSLTIDGMVPFTKNDTLSANLNKFDLSNLDFIFKGMGFDLDGIITGNAVVSDLNEDLTLLADLNINNLGLSGENFGDASIYSQWNQENKSIDLDVGLVDHEKKVLLLNGAYYIGREKDNLDFKLSLDDLNLAILSPFLNGFLQRFQGLCQGNVNIGGTLSQLDLQGLLKIKDGGCKINMLNTFYTFSPTIKLTENLITLNDMTLTDTLGNTAMVSGYIQHNHLKDMYLDIKMYPRNFLAMATTALDSQSYYGTAIANGIVTAQGPINDLDLKIKAMTQKGTYFTLPLGGSSKVKKHEFITFVSHDEPSEDEETPVVETPVPKSRSNINLGLDITVNKESQVKIGLPNGLGSMEANGDGNIKLDMATSNNSMSLIGNYVINSGSLSLNVQDVLKRTFTLESGSSISWTGDPVNGDINVTGVYQTKASISSLGLTDSTSVGSSNIKVECLVHLKNKLMNPDISFGLRLPNASEDLQQAVFYVIDTTNQSDLLLQVVSLLVFNSFSYGSTINGAGIITGQINDLISQMTNDIDININYKAGSNFTSDEMTVDLRKQLFDNRLTIETNFGVVIPSNNYSSSSTNVIGDVNVDYKITKDGRFSAQVFNRSNYNTTYYQYNYFKTVPYTQGIGFSYNRSFDKFKDLFKRRTNRMDLPNGPMIDRPKPLISPNNSQKSEKDELSK